MMRGIVHASDHEITGEMIADAVDAVLGAGAWTEIAARNGRKSTYKEMFGESYRGKPRRGEHPTGLPTGDPQLTATARRRAERVLKALFPDLFVELMRVEVSYLELHPEEKRKG